LSATDDQAFSFGHVAVVYVTIVIIICLLQVEIPELSAAASQ
jgi:hypothetical protein